ncbi:MAG: hypothetical protein AAF547_06245 [Actinomycetota bacterium]
MTSTRDTRRHYLQAVPDNHVDTRAPDSLVVDLGVQAQPRRRRRWSLKIFSYRYWAVGLTIASQLVIATAIALGGDPIIGAAAAVVMLLCGLALIAAEVATRRAVAHHLTDHETPPDPVQSYWSER